MPIIHISILELTPDGLAPGRGFVRFKLVNPVLEDPMISANVMTVFLDELGEADLEIPEEFVDSAFRIIVPGMSQRFLVAIPDTDVTLTELITDYQLDPDNLTPIEYTTITVQEQLAALQDAVDSGGTTDEQIEGILTEYFEENPIILSNIEWGDDPKPDTIFQNGLL